MRNLSVLWDTLLRVLLRPSRVLLQAVGGVLHSAVGVGVGGVLHHPAVGRVLQSAVGEVLHPETGGVLLPADGGVLHHPASSSATFATSPPGGFEGRHSSQPNACYRHQSSCYSCLVVIFTQWTKCMQFFIYQSYWYISASSSFNKLFID